MNEEEHEEYMNKVFDLDEKIRSLMDDNEVGVVLDALDLSWSTVVGHVSANGIADLDGLLDDSTNQRRDWITVMLANKEESGCGCGH